MRRAVCAFVFALLFATGLVLGYQLRHGECTLPGYAGKLKSILYALLLAIPLTALTYCVYGWLETRNKNRRTIVKGWPSRKVFFVSYAVIFICWISVFLAYYPAIMAYDFNMQSLQAAWGPPYFSAQHPIVHTLFIWVCFVFSEAAGSYQLGMALYSVVQMLIFSAALAYAVNFIYRLKGRLWACCATAFFAIFPYISILSVSVTKDTLFSGFFLVFILLIAERFLFADKWDMRKLNALTVLFGILTILFRKNAVYAMFIFFVICLCVVKVKTQRGVLGVLAGTLAPGWFCRRTPARRSR